MARVSWLIFMCVSYWKTVESFYDNVTVNYVPLQLREFKTKHQLPIGVLTTSAGAPVDVRDTNNFNSDILNSEHFLEYILHSDAQRIPERVVHAKGNGAYGYFQVTNDVSKYTSADIFNEIGKITPFFGRFSTATQSLGGNELSREHKGLAMKFYTKDGNLDLLCLHIPVYDYRDPLDFPNFTRSTRRNPKTNTLDTTMTWDFITLKPDRLHAFMWRQSDYGIPYGYRRMDIFPIHAYEVHNKKGERFIVKFNFRTELGLSNLTSAEAAAIGSRDPDYFTKDVYNAIENKKFPSWRLEMDVMTLESVKHLDYNPFDVTRLWKKGTFKTVTVGRVVINKNTDNHFRDTEQSAFNPANLVPGISGPVDLIFKGRKISYRDTQNYRLGINHNNIEVNSPKHSETYLRDGVRPLKDNMRDAPNYYPNSFSGPVPHVDGSRPSEKIVVFDKTSIDLEPASNFYNNFMTTENSKQRLASNIAVTLVNVDQEVVKKAFELLGRVDSDLRSRVRRSYINLRKVSAAAAKLDTRWRYQPLAQCMDLFEHGRLGVYFENQPKY